MSAQSLSVALPISQRVPQMLSTANHLTLEPVRGFILLVWGPRRCAQENSRGLPALALTRYATTNGWAFSRLRSERTAAIEYFPRRPSSAFSLRSAHFNSAFP